MLGLDREIRALGRYRIYGSKNNDYISVYGDRNGMFIFTDTLSNNLYPHRNNKSIYINWFLVYENKQIPIKIKNRNVFIH